MTIHNPNCADRGAVWADRFATIDDTKPENYCTEFKQQEQSKKAENCELFAAGNSVQGIKITNSMSNYIMGWTSEKPVKDTAYIFGHPWENKKVVGITDYDMLKTNYPHYPQQFEAIAKSLSYK
jgi:hypothetical protein